LFREVLGQGLSIAIVGVLIGEALSVVIGRVLGSIDADLQPAGLIVLAATGVLWIVVALLATYVPAVRASSVNPLAALRSD
jgi:ABC-type lipoprotein release transport system permease subunit